MTESKRIAAIAASVALAAFSIFTVIYFIGALGWGTYHSDCADTMYWAKASVDAGQIISSDYKYAALLPFGGNLIFQPFVAAFGLSMTTQVISMIVFVILLAWGLVLFFGSFNLEMPWAFFGTGLFFLCFSASEKMREIMWQHIIYYSLGVLFFLYLTAAINFAMDAMAQPDLWKKPMTWISMIFAALMAFICAGNGMQMILLSVFPALIGLVGRVYLSKLPLFDKRNVKTYILTGVLCVATVCGLVAMILVCHGVTAGYENAYSTYSDMDEWANNILKFPNQWFSLLGVDITGDESLMDIASIFTMIKLFYGCVLFIMPFVLLFRYKYLKSKMLRYMVLAHLGMSFFVIFGYIFGKLSAGSWRLIPVVATAFLTCFLYAYEKLKSFPKFTVPLLALLVMFALVSGISVYKLSPNSLEDNVNYKLGKVLSDNGLTKGYATFWHAPSVTVLSNGESMTVSVTVDEDGVHPYYYQNERTWFEDVEGQEDYYLILTKKENETLADNDTWNEVLNGAKKVISLDDMGYFIYVFDDNLPFEE